MRPHRVHGALALAAGLVLTACWPQPHQNPDRTAHNSLEAELTVATVDRLTELWDTDLGLGPVGQPIVAGGGVVATAESGLHSVDLRNGRRAWTWRVPPPADPYSGLSDPYLVGDRILEGYGIGQASASFFSSAWIDPDTGATLGTAGSRGFTAGVRDGEALATTDFYGSGTLRPVGFALYDVETGALRNWGTAAVTDRGPTPTFTLGSTAIFASVTGIGDNGVVAYPLDHPGGDPCGPPVLPIFACPTWTTDVAGVETAPVLGFGEQFVYVGTDAGTVAGLDAVTGAVLWTADVGAPVTEPPALAGETLYVGTATGDVVALWASGCGAATCPPLWSASTGTSPVATQPAVAGVGVNAVVYAATEAGGVHAFPAEGCGVPSCDALWRASVDSPVTGGPIVSAGRVIVGTEDGRLVAFGLRGR